MKKFYKNMCMQVLLFFTCCFLCLYVQADASGDLKTILSPMTSIQANFHQKVMDEKGKVRETAEGKMWLKKPGQFRWEILGNEPRLVVSDGAKVWDYDKDLEQATVQKLSYSKGQSRAPIFFLSGDVRTLDKDFLIKNIPSNANSNTCLSGSDSCFELQPKDKQGSFQWIRIGFVGNQLKELVLLDQLGQHAEFVFSDVAFNKEISGNLFRFTPPKGTDVVEN